MTASSIAGFCLSISLLVTSAAGQCDVNRIEASNALLNDDFGSAVSLAGDRMLVGAPGSDLAAADGGAAYLYENVAGVWMENILTASDSGAGHAFGLSVAVDGDIAVVGAPAENTFGFNSGAVYIFERIAGTWTEVQKLIASNAGLGDLYGISVSVSGDRVIVGACQLSSFDIFGVGNGKLFVYERAGATWNETALLTATDGTPGDRFGVAHDSDGDLLLISAENKNITGPTSGAAYLFELSGGTWNELDRIEPSDGVAGDFFSMGLAVENNVVVCGSPEHDTNGSSSGALYVYERSGNTWSETQKLLASGGAADDWFGRSVALQNSVIWAGAHANATSPVTAGGTAYAFSQTAGVWSEKAALVPSDAALGDQHGYAVAVDGGRLVVGSRKDNAMGSVYEYSSVLANVEPLGCDLNPVNSLAIVSGSSDLGASLVLAAHNPLGTQTPSATIPFLAITRQSLLLGNGCGFPFAWDMTGGSSAELLVDPGTLLELLVMPIWLGSPVTTTIPMPTSCSLVGTTVAVQAVLLDTAVLPGGVKFALTRGLKVTLGH